jgi:Ca2+-transporting ATPase
MAASGGEQVIEASSTEANQWWAEPTENVLRALTTDKERGLTDEEATNRQRRWGRNELAEEPPISLWRRILDQVNQLVIWILIVAVVISAVAGDWIDTAAILAIVILNVAIGVFQEERANRALAALRKMASPTVRVLRSGSQRALAAAGVVPGDVLALEAGDNIPADVRLLTTFGFRCQEAPLTGESSPVDKNADDVLPASTQLADRKNMAFMGASVAAGQAAAVVVAVGMATELGQIAGMLQQYAPQPTPLQRRLAELGRILIVACLVVVAVVFSLHLYRGGEFLEVLLLSISLAVAAVPEGLPAVVTLTLAVGLQRMVKRNALIRRLPSVETLGAVTVICTDKTGTLTRNEMTIREIIAGGKHYDVTGTGFTPHGEFLLHETAHSAGPLHDENFDRPNHIGHSPCAINPISERDLFQVLMVGAHCNKASLQRPGNGRESWSIVGDPTEGALLVAAAKAGIDVEQREAEVIHEIPFDSDRKAMSVVVRDDDSRVIMYTKGAPEVILNKCAGELRAGSIIELADERRREIRAISSELASQALRVLALAYREHHPDDGPEYAEEKLVFAGIMGMIDPPREEAIEAVRQCREAGIRPVMITGDHPETAQAIARETGIFHENDRVVTGRELDQWSADQLAEGVKTIPVYARVSAKDKLRVVEAWQACGDVVAMTGDGVNDAPAIKTADIGVAMGRTGSDVTKETADMVLMDDNFASIVKAVEEGRGIFDNIQKFVHYLLSCNAAEVLLMLIAGIAGWPAPLSALQILWINLVTDGLPALALGMEPPERDVMRRSPRAKREPVITWARGLQMLGHGLLMAATASATFWWIYRGDAPRAALAQSVTFCVMAYMQLFYSFSCRSLRDTMPEVGLFTNPYLLGAIAASSVIQFFLVIMPASRVVFEIKPDVLSEWPLIAIAALVPVTTIEITKLVRRGAASTRLSL